MKLNIIVIIAVVSTTLIQSSEFSIKFAQQKDVPACTALHKKVSNEFFKPTITTGYPDYFANNKELLHDFFNEIDNLFNQALTSATNNTENNKQHFLIASDLHKPDKILGLCAFRKKDDSIFIDYMIVDEQSRKKGIGKTLFNIALITYKDVTSCKLETLNNGNEAMHKLYERYGFVSTKQPCTVYDRTPDTHIMYELNLKK